MRKIPSQTTALEADKITIMSRLGWANRHDAAYQGIPYHDEIFANGAELTLYVPVDMSVCADNKDEKIQAAIAEVRASRELLSIELMRVPNAWLEETGWLNDSLADSIANLADRLGVANTALRDLYNQSISEAKGSDEDSRSQATALSEKLGHLPITEQATLCLDAGATADQIASAIWGADKTWAQVKHSYGRDDDEVLAIWENAGFSIVSTGGGCNAAMKTYQGVQFWITDYTESDCPNPDFNLSVGAYVPNTGEWLNHNEEVENLQDAIEQIPVWAAKLQVALSEAQEVPAPAPRPSRGPTN